MSVSEPAVCPLRCLTSSAHGLLSLVSSDSLVVSCQLCFDQRGLDCRRQIVFVLIVFFRPGVCQVGRRCGGRCNQSPPSNFTFRLASQLSSFQQRFPSLLLRCACQMKCFPQVYLAILRPSIVLDVDSSNIFAFS